MVVPNRERIEVRRALVYRLKLQGFPLLSIAQACIDEDLCPTPQLSAARELVKNDLKALRREFVKRGTDAEAVPWEAAIYCDRLTDVLHRSFVGMRDEALPPNVQHSFAQLAAKTAEQLAAVHGVNTKPRPPAEGGTLEDGLRRLMGVFRAPADPDPDE